MNQTEGFLLELEKRPQDWCLGPSFSTTAAAVEAALEIHHFMTSANNTLMSIPLKKLQNKGK